VVKFADTFQTEWHSAMKIAIAKLEEGEHRYQFHFRREDVGLSADYGYNYGIDLDVSLTKMGDEFLVRGRISTQADLVCDRCAEPYVADIQDEMMVLYTLSSKLIPEDEDKQYDEVHRIDPGLMEIDLSEDIRQTLIVALPLKRLCSPDCKGLCPRCGANLNFEKCTCEVETIDPRWEALKKLLK